MLSEIATWDLAFQCDCSLTFLQMKECAVWLRETNKQVHDSRYGVPKKDTQTLQKVLNWNLLAASSRVLAFAEWMTSEPVYTNSRRSSRTSAPMLVILSSSRSPLPASLEDLTTRKRTPNTHIRRGREQTEKTHGNPKILVYISHTFLKP